MQFTTQVRVAVYSLCSTSFAAPKLNRQTGQPWACNSPNKHRREKEVAIYALLSALGCGWRGRLWVLRPRPLSFCCQQGNRRKVTFWGHSKDVSMRRAHWVLWAPFHLLTTLLQFQETFMSTGAINLKRKSHNEVRVRCLRKTLSTDLLTTRDNFMNLLISTDIYPTSEYVCVWGKEERDSKLSI